MARAWVSMAACMAACIAALVLSSCASQTPEVLRAPNGLPERAELIDTPYFSQQMHQCGPASLAMALGAAGLDVSPETLEALVYLPSRQGSLQPEMLAAARRHGMLATRIKPRMHALLHEIAQGNPVLVLQNLGLSWLPQWHYAVVIGYDLRAREIILRSGPNPREPIAMSTFEHTWSRGGYWGMTVLRPGKLPAEIDLDDAAQALAALETYARPDQMPDAYRAAIARWPNALILQIGLGNSLYRLGDLPSAEAIFRAASDAWPDSAVALNNLASVLQDQGRLPEALAAADKAAAIVGPWQAQASATRDAIRSALGFQTNSEH